MRRRFRDWCIRRRLRRHGLAEPTRIIRTPMHPVSEEMIEDTPDIQELIRARHAEYQNGTGDVSEIHERIQVLLAEIKILLCKEPK
jgi:hypothetical protein